MSASTMRSRRTPPAASDQDPIAYPPCVEDPSSRNSLLDNWEHWPENDPRFHSFFDAAWPVREEFCDCKLSDCEFCSETRQVFHVSAYTSSGQRVVDRKVNTQELHEHLQELEKSDDKSPTHPIVRMFFVCGNYVHRGLRYAYMRHFLAYCRIPPHFVLRRTDNNSLPVFQAAYVGQCTRNTPSKPQRGILHIYLQCYSYVSNTDCLARPEYYSAEFVPQVRSCAKVAAFVNSSPSLYLRFDESSRECVVYVADSAMTFHSLRDVFSSRPRLGVSNEDPFLLVAVFLEQRIAESQVYLSSARRWMSRAIVQSQKLTSLDTDSSALFYHFSVLAVQGPNLAQMKHETSSILRAIRAIEDEHRLFIGRDANGDDEAETVRLIKMRLQRQHALAMELESTYAALVSGVEILKDLMVGHAQLLNGLDMATMAKDNRKQADATEAFAEDARNDSKIMKRDSATMKTITVVTLVYLPATFVSTLLSMGIFDFGVGDGEPGRIRIAREGWIFLAISLPLTILTLGLAFLWKQSKERTWRLEEDAAAARQKRGKDGDGDSTAQVSVLASAALGPGDATPPLSEKGLLVGLPRLRRRSARPADVELGDMTE